MSTTTGPNVHEYYSSTDSDTDVDREDTVDYGGDDYSDQYDNYDQTTTRYCEHNCSSQTTSRGFFATVFFFFWGIVWFALKLVTAYLLVHVAWVHLRQVVSQQYLVPTYGTSHVLSNCDFVQERDFPESVLFYLFC